MFIFECSVIANDVNVILDYISSNIMDIVIRTVNEITGNYITRINIPDDLAIS